MSVVACCSALQCVAVNCSELQGAAVRFLSSRTHIHIYHVYCTMLQCMAVCYVAVCCSVLQCMAVSFNELQRVAAWCSVVQCGAVWCSGL